MEKLIEELTAIIDFKNTTVIGDIVLVVVEENQNVAYAKVTDIQRDDSRKDEWWHVHLAFLGIPIQQTIWTLRTEQMTGAEVFTMSGNKRFVKAVNIEEAVLPEPSKPEKTQTENSSKAPFLKRVK